MAVDDVCGDVLEEWVFDEPRTFTLKQAQEEISRRGGNYNCLDSEITDFQSRGILTYSKKENKYVPIGLTKKKQTKK